MSLTKRQSDVLYFIHKHTHNGVTPSYPEIAAGVGVKGKSQVHRLICALEERGYIKRHPHKARSIHILKLPQKLNGLGSYSDKELLAELALRKLAQLGQQYDGMKGS